MKNACLFRNSESKILVSAEEVKSGKYDRKDEFVDPEYEFKVQYVNGAKSSGAPYFRLYYSYEEYKKLYPDRADRYEIVANMRKYQESKWHRKWKEKFSSFCEIEKCIKNESLKKWKFADVFCAKNNICVEFQHSYISFDFEDRNEFYRQKSLKTIWLYDLTYANICKREDGLVEILENNANGFFRISEKPNNLFNNYVYIQVKTGEIFRVKELLRRKISKESLSTIRCFKAVEQYTEEEFVEIIKTNRIETEKKERLPQLIEELWQPVFSWMIIKNTLTEQKFFLNCNRSGNIFRKYGKIVYKLVEDGANIRRQKEYLLEASLEKQNIWILEAYALL